MLLILAGVSIATLTGNNGILTQANQAKENNNSAAAKEKVQVEALGSIDKSGKFNESTFEENVTKNIKGSTVKKSGNSLIVTVDGYDVTVDATTGNSSYSNDSINNIRDLGGNLIEWTLEAGNTNLRVTRGGDYNDPCSPSFRYGDYPNSTDSYYGSRLTLYIK